MYELTCPSCRETQESPFVRVSAATRCPSCGHAWRISESHFLRRPVQGEAPVAVTPEPVLNQDPPPKDPMGGSSVTGLSGLSDIMQVEPTKVSPQILAGGPAPLQQARLASTSSNAPRRPDPKLNHRPRRTLLMVIAAFAAFIAIFGIVIAVMFSGSGVDVEQADDTAAQESSDAAETPDLLPQGPPLPGDVRNEGP